MIGTIFFVCWTWWISRCFPVAIFFQTESSVSYPREFRKVPWKTGRQWRSRDLWIWYQRTSWVWRKILHKSWVIKPVRGIRFGSEWCFSSQQETVARHQPKSNNESSGEATSFTFTTYRSPIIGTLRMSSRICGKVWNLAQDAGSTRWRPTYWSGTLCRQQWKEPFTWDKTTMIIWMYTWIRTSEGFQNLFHITWKLVLHHQVEILNVKTIEMYLLASHWQLRAWRTTWVLLMILNKRRVPLMHVPRLSWNVGVVRFASFSKHFGHVSQKVKQSLWKSHEVDQVHQVNKKITDPFVMWEIKTEDCKLSLFQDTSFASDLQDSKSTSGGILCIFGSCTVLLFGCARSNQQCPTAVPNRKSCRWMQVLRINGLHPLQVWECVMQTLNLHLSSVQREAEARCHCTEHWSRSGNCSPSVLN